MKNIEFFEEEVKVNCIKRKNTRAALERIIDKLGKKSGEISFIFCNDFYLHKLNEQYLDHDTYTDIITFDYTEKGVLSGDIFISIDRIKENSKLFHVKQENELSRVMIHGILHLAGFKDETPAQAKKMREMEDEMMSLVFPHLEI